jgi:hypothetical protein
VYTDAFGHNFQTIVWDGWGWLASGCTDCDWEGYVACSDGCLVDFCNCEAFVNVTLTVVSATPTAWVQKLNGNQNELNIAVTELYSDGSVEVFTWIGRINNNAAGFYTVGDYTVYVDTKGNTQIRACFIVE